MPQDQQARADSVDVLMQQDMELKCRMVDLLEEHAQVSDACLDLLTDCVGFLMGFLYLWPSHRVMAMSTDHHLPLDLCECHTMSTVQRPTYPGEPSCGMTRSLKMSYSTSSWDILFVCIVYVRLFF